MYIFIYKRILYRIYNKNFICVCAYEGEFQTSGVCF